MKLGRLIQAALIVAAALLLVATASAGTINYTTAVTGTYTTEFFSGGTIVNSGLTLDSATGTGGASGTLTFTGNTTSGAGTPTEVDLGDFEIVCNSCSTSTAGTAGATFNAFTFDLYIYDSSDGAYGEFTGTSSGGTIYSNQTPISMAITWTPAQLGPGTTNAASGNFGSTYFDAPSPTYLVAANSGTPNGDTTVQAYLGSTPTPEPATMAMVGGLLIGLGALARKRRA
jgi:hypothetical protein